MGTHHVSGSLSPETKVTVLQLLDEIKTNLPFTIDLTIEERKRLPKMGDSSWAFIDRAHNLAIRNPDFLPRSFNVEDMTQVIEIYREMHAIMQAAKQLYERLEDTYKAVGADAFSDALAVYSYAKMSNPGLAMDEALKEMGRRFGSKRKLSADAGVGAIADAPEEDLMDLGEEFSSLE